MNEIATPVAVRDCEWCYRLEGLELPRPATVIADVRQAFGITVRAVALCDECASDGGIGHLGDSVTVRRRLSSALTWESVGLDAGAICVFDAKRVTPARLLAHLRMGSRWTGAACGCPQAGGCRQCQRGVTHDPEGGCLCAREVALDVVESSR